MSSISAIATLVAHPGKESELEAVLVAMYEASVVDDGCDLYSVQRLKKAPDTFVITEVYRDRDALERHQRNAALADLAPRLGELAASVDVRLGAVVAGDLVARR
jgi:quinol monooxygenase YgiN